MYLLWLHCLYLFSLKFNCLQRVLLNEKIDKFWPRFADNVLQTTWKWSNWRLTREQDGTNVSLISHIHVRFLSCVISFIVLPTLPSPSLSVHYQAQKIKLHEIESGNAKLVVWNSFVTNQEKWDKPQAHTLKYKIFLKKMSLGMYVEFLAK